jgi:hypothetical protein
MFGKSVDPCTRQHSDQKYARHKVDKSLTFIPASLSTRVHKTTIRWLQSSTFGAGIKFAVQSAKPSN